VCVRYLPDSAYRRSFLAQIDELASFRTDLRMWLRERVTEAIVGDALLAVGEAVVNAIEHGHRSGREGHVNVSIVQFVDGSLFAQVTDDGTWRPPDGNDERGRGTGIMRALSESFERQTGPEGTTVVMRILAEHSTDT
jgi:anti-sigma regulatory factor (Ser/Thr protein kinase)